MATYKLTMTVSDSNINVVKKKLEAAFGSEWPGNVEKVNRTPSRAERRDEAEGLINEAKDIVEGLKDEMSDWYDSIPENLQDGDKANTVETARDSLDEAVSNLDEAASTVADVEFPGMFG